LTLNTYSLLLPHAGVAALWLPFWTLHFCGFQDPKIVRKQREYGDGTHQSMHKKI
jgi:hypothetical protein